MEDWYTVRQAATALEISTQRVYALLAAGTLAGRKLGRVQLVSRRSVSIYAESPTRNKFAGNHLRQVTYNRTELELNGQLTMLGEQSALADDDDGEWLGLNPPVLTSEARRLYDAGPLGAREARIRAQTNVSGGAI